MKRTLYNQLTGEIIATISCDNEQLFECNASLTAYVDGEYNSKQFYIDQNQAVEKPQDPSTALMLYDFDYSTKSWQLNLKKCSRQMRQHRNGLLSQVDRVNPIWYGTLTSQQQSELSQYRQCLLDVPQQPGWPESVTWPRVPTWL